MKIVHVLPLTAGVIKDALTYYTSKDAVPFSLLVVPLRGKLVPAIVISCEEITDAKSRLRSSDFSLRRVEYLAPKNFMLPEFIEATEETAKYFAGNLGGIISALVPSNILDEYLRAKSQLVPTLEIEHPRTIKEVLPPNLQNIDKYAVQAEDDDRFSVYRGVIREEFAKGASVLLIAPAVQTVDRIHRELGRGIEQYAFAIHGKMSEKEMIARWKSIVEMKHPVLIVATPMFCSIPRADFGAFILEEESRDSYQSFSRPYFDIRYFLECYADKMRARFIAGDPFLRVETLYRY